VRRCRASLPGESVLALRYQQPRFGGAVRGLPGKPPRPHRCLRDTDPWLHLPQMPSCRTASSDQRMVHDLVLRGTNLTDELALNHVSFLKDVAPLPGETSPCRTAWVSEQTKEVGVSRRATSPSRNQRGQPPRADDPRRTDEAEPWHQQRQFRQPVLGLAWNAARRGVDLLRARLGSEHSPRRRAPGDIRIAVAARP
jgi:hypothetical protein